MKRFIKDVAILQFGGAGTMLMGVVTSFLIAKILKPANFGVYCLAFSIYSLIAVIGNPGFKPLSVMRIAEAYGKKDSKEILEALSFFIKASLMLGIIALVIGWIASPFLTDFFYGNRDIGRLARPLYLIGVLSILYNAGLITFHALNKMKKVVILENLSELLSMAFIIFILLLRGGIIEIIWGWVVAAIASSLLAVKIYFQARERESYLPGPGLLFGKIRRAKIKLYLKLSFPFGLSENVDNLYEFLPVIILGIFLSPNEVGYFKFGYSIISLPLFLFFKPISRRLMSKFPISKGQNNFKELRNIFYKSSYYSGIISILISIFILAAAHIGIKLFAKEFIPSLKIIYILLIYLGTSGFFVGVSALLQSLNKAWVEVRFKILGAAVLFISSFVLIRWMGAPGAAIAMVFSCLITKISLYIFVAKFLNELRA